MCGAAALVCFGFKERPLRFGLGMTALLLTAALNLRMAEGGPLHAERNFFGVKRVKTDTDPDVIRLVHGGTNHGQQSTDPSRRREPLSYYHRTGPIGDVFSAVGGAARASHVAVIGLGTGTLATYAEPGQRFTFYEIDPGVVRIAETSGHFSFLADCRGTYDIVLGDARLRLADARDGAYDLIVLDAFSSDAIPAHLLTREAIAVYFSKLTPSGVLAVHISNRYLRLEPLIGNLAAAAGAIARLRSDRKLTDEQTAAGKAASIWVALAREEAHLGPLADDPAWTVLPPQPGAPLWTDEYSNLVALLRWRR